MSDTATLRKPRWTPEEMELLRSCLAEGLTYPEMAARFREAGYERPQRALLMKAVRTSQHRGASIPSCEAGTRDFFAAWLMRKSIEAEARGEEPWLRMDYSRSQWEYPDCLCVTPEGRQVRVELEYMASGFMRDHGTALIDRVDMIACWVMDDPRLLRHGVQVLELSTETLYQPSVTRL